MQNAAARMEVPEEPDLRQDFRQILRGVASTVTAITTEHEGVRYGMLATAAMSIAIDPPSYLIAVNQSASAHAALLARGAFAINILGTGDHDLARHLAAASNEQRFEKGEWHPLAGEGELDGLPYLATSQATVFCKTVSATISGTHTLFIGNVMTLFASRQVAPLLYCDGAFGSLHRMARWHFDIANLDFDNMPCPL